MSSQKWCTSLPLFQIGNTWTGFCRLSNHLRAIPAWQSERQALSGLDPFHLAHLALNDATKAAELAPTAKTYELQVQLTKSSNACEMESVSQHLSQ